MKTIDSYLVSLGFTVDQPQLRKFEDALRSLAVYVERYTTNQYSGIAAMFLKTGAAIGGTIAGLEAGFLGLATRTANSDLQFQIMARRMFMSVSAFRDMKTATDALGVSLEDVMFGPPELRERYAQLMKDQSRWGLDADWEKQMRHIRDVEFEFNRLSVAFTRGFLPYLVQDVAAGLFGDTGDLEAKLKAFNDSLDEEHIKRYAKDVSDILVPAMKKLDDGLKPAWQDAKLLYAWMHSDTKVRDLFGDTAGDIAEHSIFTMNAPTDEQKKAWWRGDPNWRRAGKSIDPALRKFAEQARIPAEIFEEPSQMSLATMAARIAGDEHIDPALFLGLIKRESRWKTGAVNSSSGAYGLGQLMPENMHAFGLSGDDPEQNLMIAAKLLSSYLSGARGDQFRALESYNCLKSLNDPKKMLEFQSYYNDIQRYADEYRHGVQGGAKLGPTAFHSTIQIHVDKSNASPQDIAAAVKPVVHEELALMSQRMLNEYGGVYAS
jgi:hypothetical protein